MAEEAILEVYRREITPALYTEIRDLYKRHSMAEDARDLPGLISTLTPDCVYQLIQSLVGRGYGESDFAALLQQQADSAGLALVSEHADISDGLSTGETPYTHTPE